MKIASLFDGIGGALLCAERCGVEAVWSSEIEPFPQKVTQHHFPTVKHLGDITKINGAEVEPVDIIVGGSPCQDLSVAGKRAGMKHTEFGDEETTRSGLFMEQIRIVKEMRNASNGGETVKPRFMVWENVPGAFSSNKGEDFRIVLEETARIKDKTVSIPRPNGGKWSNAGVIVGDGFSIAWRTVDAQFWGVPQRRRRIYLVADFGGQSAPEILFEREGVRGDIAESGGKGQGIAEDVEKCINSTIYSIATKQQAQGIGNNVAMTLCKDDYKEPQAVICLQGNGIDRADTAGCNGKGWTDDICYTLNTIDRPAVCYGISSYESNSMKSSNPHSGIYEAYTSRTLDQNGGNPACNQGGIAIVQSAGFKGKASQTAGGVGYGEELAPTLVAGQESHVICFQGNGIDRADTAMCFEPRSPDGYPRISNDGLCPTLNTMTGGQRQLCIETYQDIIGALCASDRKGIGNQYVSDAKCVVCLNRVRRITPLECERLQGYPDGWTDIPGASDSARYKALGNSFAIPCAEFVIRGITEATQ